MKLATISLTFFSTVAFADPPPIDLEFVQVRPMAPAFKSDGAELRATSVDGKVQVVGKVLTPIKIPPFFVKEHPPLHTIKELTDYAFSLCARPVPEGTMIRGWNDAHLGWTKGETAYPIREVAIEYVFEDQNKRAVFVCNH